MTWIRMQRNRWVLDQLDLRPDQRVLLLGCGTGDDVAGCLARGVLKVVGIERCLFKLVLACRFHRVPRLMGTLGLRWGDLQTASDLGTPFDRVLVKAPPGSLAAELRHFSRNLRGKTRAGGAIAVVTECQSSWQDAFAVGEDIRLTLIGSGWVGTSVQQRRVRECWVMFIAATAP
ncbi:MAG: hypothetical protein KAG89_05905 [Fulvimarina manganoxydans]|nr:hypothetical protein [Fulvimarina manganoxydans]MCK5931687.1 hypothetical protein [Fulvimarina manganoxydans]